MKLRPITDLHKHWPWIRNGLLHCIDKTGERWLPEDVYLAIKAGTSFVFALETHKDVGFVVLQQHNDPDGACLFIWALWTEPGAAREREQAVYAALDEQRRKIGAKRLRMWSPRRAWEREGFWTQVSAIYEHEGEP